MVHGFVGRLDIDAELAKHAIADDTLTMLYVVWFFVSGAMFLFGAACVWSAVKSFNGQAQMLGVPIAVGAMYLAVGIGGYVYRHGDPFMLVFVTLGALLVVSSAALLVAPENGCCHHLMGGGKWCVSPFRNANGARIPPQDARAVRNTAYV